MQTINTKVIFGILAVATLSMMPLDGYAQNDDVKDFVPLPDSEKASEKPSDGGTRFRTEIFKFRNPFRRKDKDADARPLTQEEMGSPLEQSQKSNSGKKTFAGKKTEKSSEDNESSFSDTFLNELDNPGESSHKQLSDDISTNISPGEFTPQETDNTGGIRIGGKDEISANTPGTTTTQSLTSYVSELRRSKVEANDFLPPNLAVEKDENALSSYRMAVRYGQIGNYDKMVENLDSFVKNYSSSRLVPRSLYLIAIFDKEPIKRQTAALELIKNYQTSKYVQELKRRDPGLTQTTLAALGMGQKSVVVETQTTSLSVSQLSDKSLLYRNSLLEKEVKLAPTVANRLELAKNSMKLKNYSRAEALLTQLRPEVQATDKEPLILDLLSQTQMELGQTDDARINMDTVLRSWPKYDRIVGVRLNMGTVCERVGNYSRALSEYKSIEKASPGSPEAVTAAARVKSIQNLKK